MKIKTITNFFKRKKVEETKYVISEGITGCWNYHISIKGKESKSLCGKETMRNNRDITNWKNWYPKHIPISYCSKCGQMYNG